MADQTKNKPDQTKKVPEAQDCGLWTQERGLWTLNLYKIHLQSPTGRRTFKSMTMRILLAFTALLALLAAGCSHDQPNTENVMKMQLTSTAFAEGQPIPDKYTGHGNDVSPPLQWSGAPASTKSFAVICGDPDAPGGSWTHWVIFNIPATATGLPENVAKDGSLPDGSKQGKNSFGNIGYNGPMPPPGQKHRYFFTVFALDTPLTLDVGASKEDVLAAMKGHGLASGSVMGTYQAQ